MSEQTMIQSAGPEAAPCPTPLASPAPPAPPSFPRHPGETPRAYGAFLAFFALGHARSLQAVADQLGEKHDTVKAWSSKHRWSDRIHSFNSGLLQRAAETEAALRQQQAAEWARRTRDHREQEWDAAQKLLAVAQCFLEAFGDADLQKMTLPDASRALQVSSRIARLALTGATGPREPTLAPLQLELIAALKKAYAQPPAPSAPSPAPPPPADADLRANDPPTDPAPRA